MRIPKPENVSLEDYYTPCDVTTYGSHLLSCQAHERFQLCAKDSPLAHFYRREADAARAFFLVLLRGKNTDIRQLYPHNFPNASVMKTAPASFSKINCE